MLVGRQSAGTSLRQIGEGIGSFSFPAVGHAVRRTTAHLERDRSPQKRLRTSAPLLESLDATPYAGAAHKTGRAKADFELREISKEEYEGLKSLIL